MNRAAQTDDVNFPGFVFSERRDLKVGIEDQSCRAAVPHEYCAGAEMGKKIGSGGKQIPRPAIDKTAGHRTTPVRMIVFGERGDVITRHTGCGAQIGAPTALKDPPTVIASESDNVNLF